MENKISVIQRPLISAIEVRAITFKMNWSDKKISEEKEERLSFPSVKELQEYVKKLGEENERLKRDAKKKKQNYYLVTFIRNI